MLYIAVCDDEKSVAEMIEVEAEKAFQKFGQDTDFTRYQSGLALKQDIFSGTIYDIIFLDISMPDSNGIMVARHLKEYGSRTLVIFVSSREEHVFESFSAAPFRFLRKSVFQQEIEKTVEAALEALKPKDTGILIKFNQSFLKINPLEIIYIEVLGKTTRVVMTGQTLETKTTLTELESLLAAYGFIKTHRSYIVNHRFIFAIHKENLMLENMKTLIPVSRHRLTEVKNEFQRLTLGTK